MRRLRQTALLALQDALLIAWQPLRALPGGRGAGARLLARLEAVVVKSVPIALLTGLFTSAGTVGDAVATTRAVLSASITILIADYFLTQMLRVLI